MIFVLRLTKNGVSAKELQRQLGVTYKTAWRIGRQIRSLMDETGEITLEGKVELDETLVGGRKRGGKRGWGADKPCVFGMSERDCRVITQVVPNRKAKTLMPIIVENTTEDLTAYTDEFKGYSRLGMEVAYHDYVCHSRYEWARGDVHTNTIEGHWSLLKRSIRGTHTSVSPKHLQKYLNEFSFRRNHRNGTIFFEVMGRVDR